ncbi:hypothetical protein STRTUCAR8_02464 [Streptomyces turgidiscabies Car8]|uniref:Uncharacterized protein n=1 Tax=Streptomyces turgidiscabies (strain Car8) TaxID=698760 RepID=L7F9X5_STRT8|nr:hypothetical protein STRTUCAR8_02464 [Streptomyces turgidiscabies Car8]
MQGCHQGPRVSFPETSGALARARRSAWGCPAPAPFRNKPEILVRD